MSTQIKFGRFIFFDNAIPPIVPPTGPESNVLTGCSIAVFALITPPFDCII